MLSKRFSFDGWNAWEWLKGNWTTIKESGKVLIPGFLTWITTQNPEITIVLTIVGKAALDILEYYIKEY
jgi:hypothetical protein